MQMTEVPHGPDCNPEFHIGPETKPIIVEALLSQTCDACLAKAAEAFRSAIEHEQETLALSRATLDSLFTVLDAIKQTLDYRRS